MTGAGRQAKAAREETRATEAVRKMDKMMAELHEAQAALIAAREEAKEARGREAVAAEQERTDRLALMEAARALGQAEARANVSQQVLPPPGPCPPHACAESRVPPSPAGRVSSPFEGRVSSPSLAGSRPPHPPGLVPFAAGCCHWGLFPRRLAPLTGLVSSLSPAGSRLSAGRVSFPSPAGSRPSRCLAGWRISTAHLWSLSLDGELSCVR